MKKLLSLIMLLLCAVVGASAGDYPDTNYLLLGGKATTTGSITFTTTTGGGFNSKYYGTYCGNEITKGLKVNSSSSIAFTTTGVATIRIVQSTAANADKKFKINGNVVAANVVSTPSNANNQNIKIHTYLNQAAGTYTITNDGETGLLYVGITYGTVNKVTISTTSSNGGSSTVTGGADYWEGETATLTASPAAGKAFDHWELSGSNVSTDNPYSFTVSSAAEYTAVFINAATKSITATSGNASAGTAEASATTVSEGSNTILTATPTAEGYVFSNWSKSSNGSWSNTTNPLTIAYENLTDGDTYTANFKKLYTVTYNLGTYAGTTTKVLNNYNVANGINEKYASAIDKYTIPSYAHRYLYREGYILSGWTDGTNTYNTGDEITLTEDITLTPVWSATTQSLSKSTSEVTVTWSLAYSQLLFNSWQGADQIGYYTKPQTVNGETIAIPMIVDATNGKIDNSTRSDRNDSQINVGTKFTIPAVKGMIITITCSEKNKMTPENTLVGEDGVTIDTEDSSIATYTYNGSDATVTINMNAGRYYPSIAVTYPKAATFVDVTAAGYRTFASSSALDFTGGVDGLTAYRATVNAGNVTFTAIDGPVPAGEGLLIKADEGRYYIPLASGSPAAIENEFVGVTSSTTAPAGSFVLMADPKVGFYKTKAEFTVGANTAYLPAAASARQFIGFDFDEATAIKAVESVKAENAVFNLRGQRVKNLTKGLYIVNGKKVVK